MQKSLGSLQATKELLNTVRHDLFMSRLRTSFRLADRQFTKIQSVGTISSEEGGGVFFFARRSVGNIMVHRSMVYMKTPKGILKVLGPSVSINFQILRVGM